MADNTFIKPEGYIKPDPETMGASPAAQSEDDIYEDAGDLEFNTDSKWQSLYLARVPKYVWESWSQLDDDAEIQIGTIRQTKIPKGNGQFDVSLSMLLSSNVAQHQTIPKEYELDVTDQHVKNTFVFSEQDLPGFKSKAAEKFNPATANMPARFKRPKPANKPYDPNKKFESWTKKPVPKRTQLSGRVAHEVNCVAVENEESQRLLTTRTLEAMKPKATIKWLGNQDINALDDKYIQPGTLAASERMAGFIKTGGPVSNKKRPQMVKTARMPENELLDRIFACFKKYKYWSMKALRQELQQPEAYLRETLEKVAVLAKSGRFATQWSLRPENLAANYEIGDEMAPQSMGPEGNDDSEFGDMDEDEDEDVKFEDVVS
ncbi:putative transcription initiation factor IIF subunit beta [Halenospora varia]|nr:putative transcription initiation factor IIF subunit beta [Halenospora varia]